MQHDNIDRRMTILEEKLEYQDYTIEKLNDVIIGQQQQMDVLEQKFIRLLEKTDGNLLVGDKTDDEPLPPHY